MVDPEGDPGERHDEDRGKVGLEDEEPNVFVLASPPKIIWSLLKPVGQHKQYINITKIHVVMPGRRRTQCSCAA